MKEELEPGCTSCRALADNCGGHWRRTPRPADLDGIRGRVTLDVIDGDVDHDMFYRETEA